APRRAEAEPVAQLHHADPGGLQPGGEPRRLLGGEAARQPVAAIAQRAVDEAGRRPGKSGVRRGPGPGGRGRGGRFGTCPVHAGPPSVARPRAARPQP
ncbi:hypothetical protein HMPREF0731_4516, partial [Pseudoroseomonas cervicalis ATCC 49957]